MKISKIACSIGLLIGQAYSSAWATDTSLLFDKPVHEVHAQLPSDPLNPQAKATLSCFYYPHLIVKQIDMGEKGAAQLSMTYIPKGQSAPPCRRMNSKDEKVVTTWSGYFKGVKGDYVFFEGDDTSEGGSPFAVLSTEDSLLFYDDTTGIHSAKLMTPVRDPDLRPWYENPIKLRYQRVYLAPCSLRADEKKCWGIIKDATGLTDATPPDCNAAYAAQEKDASPEQIKEITDDPSVIMYEVEAVLDDSGVIRVAPTSKAEECYPAD